jgi:viroplasmin and RNaseH domain-containing protein
MSVSAYVDGSYREGQVGWASVIVKAGKAFAELSGVMTEEEVQGTRQVAGELKAVEETLAWCKKHKVEEISIYYDYTGIREWVVGSWKAKKEITQKYRNYVRACGIKIHWVKVESHTGVKFNEMADEIARSLIGG